jgi:aspartate-semialdehyde dehydrogenase
MNKHYNIAIVGATGAVGADMLRVLTERDFPINRLKLLASARSKGKKLVFKGKEIEVEELTHDSFKNIDIALFSAGASRSIEFAPSAVLAGAIVVDNSSAFRMDPNVPLIVPEVNSEDVLKHNGIIANPNCSTIIMVVPVAPLHKAKKLKRIIASTYQAVSGAGVQGMKELEKQTMQVMNKEEVKPKKFPHQIAFNLFPHIDIFLDNDYTKEEMKMVFETRKIMSLPKLQVNCTCVRLPVFRAHSESLLLEFEKDITPEEARKILASSPGVKVLDNVSENIYPMPVTASGKDDVLVGRIRQDISRNDKKGLSIFIAGDQLLKGAALNAVQIAELL